jgi:integrative and conjugative element protein (TIGR02256 family)
LMNYDSEIEFLSFLLKFPKREITNIDQVKNETVVEVLGHRNPLTLNRAKEISGSQGTDYRKILFLGCGAVGSKMILHFARSGHANCSIVDTDVIFPHNLVRHGLLHEGIGWNKAAAMSETIKGMFYADERSTHVESIEEDAVDLLLNKTTFLPGEYQWIIDASASPVVQHALTVAKLPESLHCCRCEIAYSGKLGFMSIEGSGRRPRLDDIHAFVFDKAVESDEISKWLQTNRNERESELGSRLQEVNIGLSCSSETMRLSDEIVSLHSAAFTAGFKKIAQEGDFNEGYTQINYYDESKESPFRYSHLKIPQTVVLRDRYRTGWEVRLIGDTEKTLRELFSTAIPDETGGILIGLANWKRRTVYVTRILEPPLDSYSSPYAFVRGTSDIPDEIERIHERTGAMLGYVGEWHTHPDGEPQPSLQDLSTVKKIKPNLDKVPLPTLLLIVTEGGIYPYIYP